MREGQVSKAQSSWLMSWIYGMGTIAELAGFPREVINPGRNMYEINILFGQQM